ncbi:hypothetical protein ABQX22_22780 [Xanthomonas sp. WHRI 1810A]|uniref:hypothetical protein n=1 Tax=Xanthomonas sp. WHRI 1810A TaxID=3161565 RepID=UPI0032E8D5D2
MGKYKKFTRQSIVPFLLLAVTYDLFAGQTQSEPSAPLFQTESAAEQSAPVTSAKAIESPDMNGLSDKLHIIRETLKGKGVAHYYKFKAVRGQKVILSTPIRLSNEEEWKVEFKKDGLWEAKTSIEPIIFSELLPGDFVIVRVTHMSNVVELDTPYVIALGSYPIIKNTDLRGTGNNSMVPLADGSRILGAQTYSGVFFRAEFADSTGVPLEGGRVLLSIFLTEKAVQPNLIKEAFSDANGEAKISFELGKCYGGEKNSKRNVAGSPPLFWNSQYNVGGWYAHDGIVGDQSSRIYAQHVYGIAHVCSRTLVRGQADRW